jgi:transcriptional regulator with XRE-family HTH domain
MITPAQIRAARLLLGWRQIDLARASGLSDVAIKNIERGLSNPRSSTLERLQKAFDQASVLFLEAGDIQDGGPEPRVRVQRRP